MTTPTLTNWAGMLTLDGETLAAWMVEQHLADTVRAAAQNIVKHPEKAARLWEAYSTGATAEKATSENVLL